MKEIDVALTDFVLAAQTFFLSRRIWKRPPVNPLRESFLILFLGFGLASAAGGIVHGFTTHGTLTHSVLWTITLVSIGVTACGFALAGSRLVWEESRARAADRIILGVFIFYGTVLIFHRAFLIAILFYVPATLVTLAGLAAHARRHGPDRCVRIGVAGMVLSLAAPFVQIFGISLHPVYFTYNAVYHVIMMIVVGLFYVGVEAVLDRAG